MVIGVATAARRTEIINELAAQQGRYPDLRIELYDQRRLSELPRDRPDIVRTFFGDGIAERFCLASEAAPTRADAGVLDATALADAVMRGPVEATGVAGVLAEAERWRDDQPDEAAAAYARVEQALEDNGFAAHALLIRRRRAAVLRAARRLDEAVELLADLAWIYLDRGDVDEARMVLRELNETVGQEGSASDAPGVVSAQTRLLQQAVDASVTLLQDPIDRLDSLGAVIDQLVAERHHYAGRATVLFAETALAAEQTGEILGRASALHVLAADLTKRSDEDKELAIRLRLCLADAEGQWQDLLDAARRRRLPNEQAALVLARYARDRAWQADPKAAEDCWREAVERGCLARLHEDAADWLYAQRNLRIRYGPIDASLEEPHHLAQALRAAGGGRRLADQRRDPRELGLDRLQRAASCLRQPMRCAAICGSAWPPDGGRASLTPINCSAICSPAPRSPTSPSSISSVQAPPSRQERSLQALVSTTLT